MGGQALEVGSSSGGTQGELLLREHGGEDLEVEGALCQGGGGGLKVEEEVARRWRGRSPRRQGRRPSSSSSPSSPPPPLRAAAERAAPDQGRLPGPFSACKKGFQDYQQENRTSQVLGKNSE